MLEKQAWVALACSAFQVTFLTYSVSVWKWRCPAASCEGARSGKYHFVHFRLAEGLQLPRNSA